MKNAAFTLIELIIVIVLLGILAATALPRFVDFSLDAKESKHATIVAAMQSAVKQANLLWRMKGEGSTIDINGTDVYFNSAGYPESTLAVANNGVTNAECEDIWNYLVPDFPTEAWATGNCSGNMEQCTFYTFTSRDAGGNWTVCRYRMYEGGGATRNDIIYAPLTGEVGCHRSLNTINYYPAGFTACDWSETP